MRQQRGVLLVLIVAGLIMGTGSGMGQDAELARKGEAVYESRCVICHGAKGDGMGLTGVIHRAQQNGLVVTIYPRDFTAGVFKFRSTPSGYLPTDEDLMRIVTEGVARSGMPGHTDLTIDERKAVIEYIKTFSPRWQDQRERGEPVGKADAPAFVGTPESAERGRQVYAAAQCGKCHGDTGRGDGPSSATLQDSWGNRILPFDFTSGPLKGGSSAEQIYRTFVTGLDGTPMPSYEDALPEQDRWDLVSYCLELMKGQAR